MFTIYEPENGWSVGQKKKDSRNGRNSAFNLQKMA